jgi:hypothetical protein
LFTSSCIEQEDDSCTIRALEKQAKLFPKKETWPNLTLLLFRAGGEANTLNIFRLSREVGGMVRGEEFTEMAQLSIRRVCRVRRRQPSRRDKPRVCTPTRPRRNLATRLLATAKTQAAADKPTLLKQDVESAAKKNGEVDVRIATAFLSYGDHARALPPTSAAWPRATCAIPEEAELNLGIAQLKAGNKEAAAATFGSVKGDETLQRLARLWAQRTR